MNSKEYKSKEDLLLTALSALLIVAVVVVDSLLIKVPYVIFICLASLIACFAARFVAITFKST